MKLVDTLYINNGYSDPRAHLKKTGNISIPSFHGSSSIKKYMIKLTFVSHNFSREVNPVRSSKTLPFTVIYTRATTLLELFRPLDSMCCKLCGEFMWVSQDVQFMIDCLNT